MAVALPTTNMETAATSGELHQYYQLSTFNVFQQLGDAGAGEMGCQQAKFTHSSAYRDNVRQFETHDEVVFDGFNVKLNRTAAENDYTAPPSYTEYADAAQPATLQDVVTEDRVVVQFNTAESKHQNPTTVRNVSNVTGNYNNVVNHHYNYETSAAETPDRCTRRQVIAIVTTLATLTGLIVTTVPLGVCYGVDGSCGSHPNEVVSTALPPVENRTTDGTSFLPQTSAVTTVAKPRANYVHVTITP